MSSNSQESACDGAVESLASKFRDPKARKERETKPRGLDCVKLTAQAGKNIDESAKFPPKTPPQVHPVTSSIAETE